MAASNKTQNFQNHSQYVPAFHFLTFGVLLILLVASIYLAFTTTEAIHWLSAMFALLVLCIMSVALHNRSFALKAQDRAIRAEEGLRYFILTGKRLPQQLRMRQIIALRFAPDEEFVALVEAAIQNKLSSKDIKQQIKNWKADYHRA
ncbi:MAG TPA: DUF6526 family protein [Ferruginibacter sp.]|nr:DUF6526 family protein [Ferruginibacter sp.]